MNCEHATTLIEPYSDGELDALSMVEVERHLDTCPGCAAALARTRRLSQAVGQEPLRFQAPAELLRSVRAEIHPQAESQGTFWSWNRLTAWTTAAAGLSLALLAAVLVTRPSQQDQREREIVSSHIRSLMANHSVDVASSDQHTVKPWFNGKLDFSPPVRDLASAGYPLVGGRLDYLDGRVVAALVFQRHQHTINLFIWPANEQNSRMSASSPIQGYRVVRWSEGRMAFRAVSDVNEAELMAFASLFAAGEHPPADYR